MFFFFLKKKYIRETANFHSKKYIYHNKKSIIKGLISQRCTWKNKAEGFAETWTSVSQCLQVYFDAALLTPAVSLAWDGCMEILSAENVISKPS